MHCCHIHISFLICAYFCTIASAVCLTESLRARLWRVWSWSSFQRRLRSQLSCAPSTRNDGLRLAFLLASHSRYCCRQTARTSSVSSVVAVSAHHSVPRLRSSPPEPRLGCRYHEIVASKTGAWRATDVHQRIASCLQIGVHREIAGDMSRCCNHGPVIERRCPSSVSMCSTVLRIRDHTNDLRYESKLSREMLKGSFSPSRLRWLDDVTEMLDLECQKLGFSCCGDG